MTNIKANDGLKYNLKTKFQELNPGVVPTDDDLTKYFINEKNKVSGTDWNTVDPKKILGAEYSSATGIQKVMSQIKPQEQKGGTGCGA